ncbi:MAG: OmpA family protein [Ferruginibacter sp.]
MTRKEDVKIEVGGHADNVGKPAANLKLSMERANAVKDYLIAKGIKEKGSLPKGYGQTEPIADNKTEEGRATNRRTEVKILD